MALRFGPIAETPSQYNIADCSYVRLIVQDMQQDTLTHTHTHTQQQQQQENKTCADIMFADRHQLIVFNFSF